MGMQPVQSVNGTLHLGFNALWSCLEIIIFFVFVLCKWSGAWGMERVGAGALARCHLPLSDPQSWGHLLFLFTAPSSLSYICLLSQLQALPSSNGSENKNWIISIILYISDILWYFHLKLSLYNIQMKGKIYVNSLNCVVLL